MQDIFFWIPLKLLYQAAKWGKAAFHRKRGLRSQKNVRSDAHWRPPIHCEYVRSKEKKKKFPQINVIEQPSMVHLKGLSKTYQTPK